VNSAASKRGGILVMLVALVASGLSVLLPTAASAESLSPCVRGEAAAGTADVLGAPNYMTTVAIILFDANGQECDSTVEGVAVASNDEYAPLVCVPAGSLAVFVSRCGGYGNGTGTLSSPPSSFTITWVVSGVTVSKGSCVVRNDGYCDFSI